MSTTETENKEIARKFPEEAFTEGNLEVIDEIVADEYVGHTPAAPEPLRGPDDLKEFISMVRTAFPDVEATPEDVIVEEDKVVLRDRVTGTHEGAFMGLEPTGKEIEFEGTEIIRIEDGQFVESRAHFDMMNFMQQLGFFVLPGPRLILGMVVGKVKSLLRG